MPTSKDTPDITRIPAVDDAPSIAAPEAASEAASVPVIAIDSAAPEAPVASAPAAVAPTPSVDIVPEPIASEAPSLPRAAQLETPATPAPEHKAAAADSAQPLPGKAPSQAGRFTLLAASLALAACFGAIGGSLGIAGYDRIMHANVHAAPAVPAPAKVAAPDQNAEEIKLLKETIAQLRANTRALNDGLTALRTGLANTTAASAAQMTKIAETLDRVERRAIVAQAPQAPPAPPAPPAASATPPSPESTGSILPRPAAPAAANDAKPPAIVPGWVLRKVYDGAALIEGREGIIEVEPGAVLHGVGRVERIMRQDGRWVVVTTRGLIVPR